MLGHRERDRRQPRHYVISLYLAVVIAAHALALLVCSMCSPLMAVGILLNLRVNAVFPLYWRWVTCINTASISLFSCAYCLNTINMAFRTLTKIPKLCLVYFSIDKTTCIVETKKLDRAKLGSHLPTLVQKAEP